MSSTPTDTCYRHTDRRAGVRCQRCSRPICPSCMVQASVGFHCPECAQSGRQKVHTARSLPGTDPITTKVLIGINVAAFVALIATSVSPQAAMAGQISGPVFRNFSLFGLAVAFDEPCRLLTGAFLHAGLVHLGFNMFLLWILGSQLELVLGRARYVALYFTSLFAGSLGVMLLDPGRATVGASGAVFGLMGVAFLFQRSRGIDPWRSGIGGLLALNLVFTFLWPGISVGGHLGGLAGGLVAGSLLLRFERDDVGVWPAIGACVALSAAAILGALWAANAYADSVPGLVPA